MSDLIVDVPQNYIQTDSVFLDQRDRKCFTSTCAMAVKFHLPQALLGANADDDYFRTVRKYGDSTSAAAQRAALKEYGLESTFRTNAKWENLRSILSQGRPVPVGWLHHGPATSPRGGGHWTLLTGITSTHTIHHDPYGEADMVRGGYVRRGNFGRNIRYSIRNWLPRWTWGGEGWLLDVRNPSTRPSEAPVIAYAPNWAAVRAIAAAEGSQWPQVVAAQWALESGWGRYPSGKHNYFGIKGTPGTVKETKEHINGQWVTIKDTFKDYPSANAGIADLIRLWYKDFRHHKGVNRASSWEECCRLLHLEGYATDPTYPDKLIKLIKEND
jgi:hypothetical protein